MNFLQNPVFFIKNTSYILHYEQYADGTVKCIEDEIPFEIPEGWEWCNLGLLFNHNTGKALNSSNKNGKMLTYITTSNVYWDRFELGNLKSMPFTDSEIEKCTVKRGDLIICEGGDIGRASIWNFDYEIRIQNHIHKLRAYNKINCKFYYYILYLYKINGKINGNGIGLQGLSSNVLHSIIVPLPPLAEQIKIVKQINSLFSLIEKIERNKSEIVACVDRIKYRILDLAIRGKLVPQDPNDEPASVLLERIRAEKEELIKQGKIKRDKKESVIYKGDDNSYYEKYGSEIVCIDDEILFEIPKNWSWVRLSSMANIVMGSSPKSQSICLDNTFMEFHQGKIYFTKRTIGHSNQYTSEITKIAPNGSVLLCVRAPVGEVNITDRDICIGRGLASIHPCAKIPVEFLFYWLQPYKKDLINKSTGSTFSAVISDNVQNILLPLPPIEEQRRILLSIENLMRLLENVESDLK